MMAFLFLILRYLGYVDTQFDWLLFALFYIGDQVSGIAEKIQTKIISGLS